MRKALLVVITLGAGFWLGQILHAGENRLRVDAKLQFQGTGTYLYAICDTVNGVMVYTTGYEGGAAAVSNGCQKTP